MDWRHLLYYSFGLLPSLFFALRFFLQWINSEKKRVSYVDKNFWRLSLCGNVLLSCHYFIQIQYLVFILQIANGFIAWRNLNLLKSSGRITFRSSVGIFLAALLSASLLFFLQPSRFLFDQPAGLGSRELPFLWHLFGSVGCILFASRFWIQWLDAERARLSRLGKSFWILSIVGSIAALLYFLRLGDWISSLNYSVGLIPYIRNLMLLKHKTPKTGY